MAERFDRARIIDVVGSGASNATAGGALLLREAARAHTAAHETYNYLHGPMEPVDDSCACIVVGDDREVRLARELSSLGCQTLLVTRRSDVEPDEALTVLTLPSTRRDGAGDPAAAAARVSLAARRGLRADGFRYEQDDIKLDGR